MTAHDRMTRSEKMVRDLLDEDPNTWSLPWREFCISSLASKARKFLKHFDPLQINDGFGDILERSARIDAVSTEDGIDAVSECLADKKRSNFRSSVEERLQNGSQISASKARQLLSPPLGEKLRSEEAHNILASVTPYDVYEALAGLLGKELHQRLASETPDPPESELLNRLCLINYLQHWELQPPQLLGLLREQPCDLVTALPGICEACDSNGARTLPILPIEQTETPAIPEEWQVKSCLLASVAKEAQEIPAGNGYMHRMIDLDRTPARDVCQELESRGLDFQCLSRGRDLMYRQEEYYSLLFSALSGLEFVIRSSASPRNAAATNIRRPLADTGERLGQSLHDKIMTVFDSRQLNLRNRSLHGLFFDIEARRSELIQADGLLEPLGVPSFDMDHGWLPKETACFVVSLLSEASRRLDASVSDTGWTNHYSFYTEEWNFVRHLHCDILDSFEIMREWHDQISRQLESIAPCIRTPLEAGIVGWNERRHDIELLPQVIFLFLLLEPLVRAVLLRQGKSVIEQCRKGSDKVTFRYHMLDCRGLLSEGNIESLTAHIGVGQRDNAKRTLRLAAKARDSLAHGAITDFTEDLRRVQGHVMFKSIQLLTTVPLNTTVNARRSYDFPRRQ